MNQRIMQGIAVVGSSLALAGSAEAQSFGVSKAECAPIYDQTNGNKPDPDLQEQIKKLEDNGVQANVQIFGKENGKNFSDIHNIEAYQDEREYECGGSDAEYASETKDIVDVTIDEMSRDYSVYDPYGKIDESLKEDFEKDLKDTDSSYQEDVKKLLEGPSAFHKVKEWVKDDGYLYIGGGAGVIGLLALVGWAGSGGGGSGGGRRRRDDGSNTYVYTPVIFDSGSSSSGSYGGDGGGGFSGGDGFSGSF